MNTAIPTPTIFPPYYQGYIQLVASPLTLADFETASKHLVQFVQTIPASKYEFRYAEGKWTIKEICRHLIDCERIFSYRALCFARKEMQAMLPFEENDYVANASAQQQDMEVLLEEWRCVRKATIALFQSFRTEDWHNMGKIGELPIELCAIPYILIGHQLHHSKVYQERYM